MKVFLGGARGSFPVSGEDTLKFGGETFALLIEGEDGTQLLVDAGSGVQRMRERLRPGATLLFTHTHLDHLIGLPALTECWPAVMVSPRSGLADVLERVFSPPVWPVRLPAAEFVTPSEPFAAGGLRVSWREVAHPDGCVAYRVDEAAGGASVVVATDIEWQAMPAEEQAGFVEFARGAGLVVFDGQFAPEEYGERRGWGHSTWGDAVEVGGRCGAGRVWVVHHAPGRGDGELEGMGRQIRGGGVEVVMAGSGAVWEG